MDLAESGEPIWPDLLSGPQSRDRLDSRFWGLDDSRLSKKLSRLHNCSVLKEAWKYYNILNSEIRSWKKYKRYIDKRISTEFLIAYSLLRIRPYIWLTKKSTHLSYTLSYSFFFVS